MAIPTRARLSLDASFNNADAVQNGRILMDHLYRHLSQAERIMSVSGSGESLGYIEFTDYAETTYRYDISDSNYVEYGELGSLVDIAGPVSQLQFRCYDGNDMASGPITDVNAVNLINIEVTITNSGERAQDKVFSTTVFLNGGAILTTPYFEGWWCGVYRMVFGQ